MTETGGPATSATDSDSDLQPDLAGWQAERDAFLASLREATSEVIVVSNEVGTGLVPEHAASRLFRDEHGRLNQMVAAACDEAFLVTAGLALRLK
jgi:adenosylcobinamide kinase/adenosylcobinamide-phosphate guanylyltransferase